ncbi:MAG: hypothetical protein SFV15_10475 [Polyangiaceae bacterium]|nr:hypothetical protein [Polyangiaceae bacterium]
MTSIASDAAASAPPGQSFWRVYWLAFVRPARAMNALVQSRGAVRFGACSVAITGVTYSLVYFFLSQNGGRPTVFEPWLAIPAEDYYRYNLLFNLPSVLLAWVAATGFTHLAAQALGGKGTFETTLGTLGLGIGVASWGTGLHDLLTSCMGYQGLLDQRAYEDAMSAPGTAAHRLIWTLMLLYSSAFLLLFTRGVGVAHGLRLGRAFACGALGFAVYQGIFVLFNR